MFVQVFHAQKNLYNQRQMDLDLDIPQQHTRLVTIKSWNKDLPAKLHTKASIE